MEFEYIYFTFVRKQSSRCNLTLKLNFWINFPINIAISDPSTLWERPSMSQWEGEIGSNTVFLKQYGPHNTKSRIAVQVSRLKLHFHSDFQNILIFWRFEKNCILFDFSKIYHIKMATISVLVEILSSFFFALNQKLCLISRNIRIKCLPS